MPRYAVLLHGKGLRLLNQEGMPAAAGVYTWRVVDAESEADADRVARARLLSDESFTAELWNSENEPVEIEIDEISQTRSKLSEDSGLVYYFENEGDYPYGTPSDDTKK